MDQMTSDINPPLTFALVNVPNARTSATLAFQGGRLVGQLEWKGCAHEYRGRLALGQHLLVAGGRVIVANGAYGDAESYALRPVDDFVLKAFNGGAR